jgi:DNA-binding MarR family transcriptional regulator
VLLNEDDTLSKLFKQIHDAMERRANNELQGYGITMTQMMILAIIQRNGGSMPLKELEKRLHLAQSTAAGVVVRMEQKGFVSNQGDDLDARVKVVRITEKGIEVVRMTEADRTRAEEVLLCGLSSEEQQALRPMLEKICRSLNAGSEE